LLSLSDQLALENNNTEKTGLKNKYGSFNSNGTSEDKLSSNNDCYDMINKIYTYRLAQLLVRCTYHVFSNRGTRVIQNYRCVMPLSIIFQFYHDHQFNLLVEESRGHVDIENHIPAKSHQ